jgi:hypothetical protein
MKFVFRVSSRLRSAAPIPRDFLPISGLEHLGLCYQQKVVTDPAEFNAIQATIADPRFPNRGAKIEAYALTEEDEAKLAAKPVAVVPPPAPPVVESFTPEDDPEVEIFEAGFNPVNFIAGIFAPVPEPEFFTPDPEPAPRFRMEGTDIYEGDERVGGIFDGTLRAAKGKAELRPDLEAWLQSQPQ